MVPTSPTGEAQSKVQWMRHQAWEMLLDFEGTLLSDGMQRTYLQKTERHRREVILKWSEVCSLAVPGMPFGTQLCY